MVTFQEAISSNIQRKSTIQEFEMMNSESKKRRWGEDREEGEEDLVNEWKFKKILKTKSLFDDIKFHQLEKPSTLEDSKKCLHNQSGEVHYYNTKNQLKTTNDHKDQKQSSQRLLEMGPLSLDLELNLFPYDSPRSQAVEDKIFSTKHDSGNDSTSVLRTSKSTSNSKDSDRPLRKLDSLKRCPSWMSMEADQREMVAAACMQCHMLVMLCKSSPACPNCKFMHPPGHQSPINLFKPRFSTTLSWKN